MNKKAIYKFSAGFVFCLAVLGAPLFFNNLTIAQEEATGVRLQPAIIEDAVNPGEVFKSKLSVTNISGSQKTFYFISRDISGISPEGSPIFVEEGEKTEYSLSAWITTSVPSVTLGANEMREIPFSVNIPKDASPGGHFAGLFVTLEPPKIEGIGSGVGYQVATIISLQIAGETTEEARIREFATGKFVYTKPEVDFRAVIENMGNVLVRARGPLEITDVFGKKVATLVVNDQGAVVLPDSNREFKSIWTGEGLSIGRYQAVLAMVYGNDGRKTITATTSFWVLPLNLVLTMIGGIIAFIVLFFGLTHIYIRNKLSKMNSGRSEIYSGKSASSKSMMITLTMLMGVAMTVVLMMVFFA